MNRLFTFGCSFTQYFWPTWADLLSYNYDVFQNYAMMGGGNLFIASTVAEAIAYNKINKDDTVMIMWTNVTREDRYINNWHGPGNIFTQKYYPEEYVKKYITIRGCYVRDLAQISLVDQALQNIGCKYEFLAMTEIANFSQYTYEDSTTYIKDGLDLYRDTLDKIKPSVHDVIFNKDWNSRKILDKHARRLNAHPLPNEHLEYLQRVLPYYPISQEAIDLANITTQNVKDQYNKRGGFRAELYDNKKMYIKKRL